MAKSKGRSSITLRAKQREYADDPMWDRFPWCIPIWLFMVLIIGTFLYGVYFAISFIWRSI